MNYESRIRNWVRILCVLLALGSGALGQQRTNTAVMLQGETLLPNNAAGVISNALGLGPWATKTNLVITNISGLQTALDSKLATDDSRFNDLELILNGNLPVPVSSYASVASYANGANESMSAVFLYDNSGGYSALGKVDGTWSGDLVGLAAALNVPPKPKYAVFTIPLGGSYTDFELKASTSNFATNSTYTNGMVFFYHSPDPGKSAIPEQIWSTRPDVFFTDSAWVGTTNYMNQRSWRKQSASQSIAAMRAGGVNSVIAGVVVVVRDTGVINPTNAALVWSYCRYTPTAYEADGGGRSIWMPITPKWVSQPFTP